MSCTGEVFMPYTVVWRVSKSWSPYTTRKSTWKCHDNDFEISIKYHIDFNFSWVFTWNLCNAMKLTWTSDLHGGTLHGLWNNPWYTTIHGIFHRCDLMFHVNIIDILWLPRKSHIIWPMKQPMVYHELTFMVYFINLI